MATPSPYALAGRQSQGVQPAPQSPFPLQPGGMLVLGDRGAQGLAQLAEMAGAGASAVAALYSAGWKGGAQLSRAISLTATAAAPLLALVPEYGPALAAGSTAVGVGFGAFAPALDVGSSVFGMASQAFRGETPTLPMIGAQVAPPAPPPVNTIPANAPPGKVFPT